MFVGTVRGIEIAASEQDPPDMVPVLFDVQTVLKGPPLKDQVVFTPGQGMACGYPFADDQRYLVFAHARGGAAGTAYLQTSLCENTRPIEASGFPPLSDWDDPEGDGSENRSRFVLLLLPVLALVIGMEIISRRGGLRSESLSSDADERGTRGGPPG